MPYAPISPHRITTATWGWLSEKTAAADSTFSFVIGKLISRSEKASSAFGLCGERELEFLSRQGLGAEIT